ncbi:GtrA family protein [Lentisalinibacter sediminis]|uniref:GtrA family protein n=1 Tax=Lentisalinibacter sediminis TaxID=2992237 RepID=UPI0038697315
MMQRDAKFLLVGAVGFGVDISILSGLTTLGADPILARCVSAPVAITATWILNRLFVFRTSGKLKPAGEYARHVTIQTSAFALNMAAYWWLVSRDDATVINAVVAACFGSAIGLIVNYVGSRYWTYDLGSGART